MPYLLKHYFDPDIELDHLKPQQQDDGSVDHYELNLIQNVEAGSLIAEWLPFDEDDEDADSRFVFGDTEFPGGRGTGLKRKEPKKLFAAVNGSVMYEDGKIVVRQNLTLPGDVDFHTGNLNFIGNLIVGGSVRSGFAVQGKTVSIQGQIEGARIESLENLDCRGGVKGSKKAFVDAGKTIKASFCEFGTLKAGENVLVKGSLMHSNVYAGSRLAVGGRLTGGSYYCYDQIYVGEQLGGGLGTDTVLVLGHDPAMLYADEEYNQRIKKLHDVIASYEKLLNKDDEHRLEYGPKLESARREHELLKMLKVKLWEGAYDTNHFEKCKVVVTGKVNPGVEISIGSAYLKVDDYLEDVYFYYDNDEIKIGTSAKKQKR